MDRAANSSTRVLRDEHAVIETAILAFSGIVTQLATGASLDRAPVWEMVQAFKEYVERCHQAKEGFLLSMLRARGGFSSDYPVAMFYDEHQRIQLLLSDLANAGYEYYRVAHGRPEHIVQAMRVLIDFFPAHMWKADHLLFPLADRLLSATDQEVLAQQFAWIDSVIGDDPREKLREISGEFPGDPDRAA